MSPVSAEQVRTIFAGLEHGDGAAFFEHVADDVDWTVMGSHPLAGRHRSKTAFREATFARLAKVLPEGAQLKVARLLHTANWVVAELESGARARNGMKYDNRYCWLCRFDGGRIVEVRAYLDSAMVQRLFAENPL
jgi:hypothetical protein